MLVFRSLLGHRRESVGVAKRVHVLRDAAARWWVGRSGHGSPVGRSLRLEGLEARTLLAAFQVTTVQDELDSANGLTSVREALSQADASPGTDTITFASTLAGGTITIDPAPRHAHGQQQRERPRPCGGDEAVDPARSDGSPVQADGGGDGCHGGLVVAYPDRGFHRRGGRGRLQPGDADAHGLRRLQQPRERCWRWRGWRHL